MQFKQSTMIYLFLQAPTSLASAQSQTNDLVVDIVIKDASEDLTIFLFGTSDAIQRYIPTLYTILWDYCLLYDKMATTCTVLPYIEQISSILIDTHTINVQVPAGFPVTIIDMINAKRDEIAVGPVVCTTITSSQWTDEVFALDWETSSCVHVKSACVGGTFDCLHPGHKILLTLSALICDTLIIGLTTDVMLHSKKNQGLIKPYDERKQLVIDFLHIVAPTLSVVINPLKDIYGPAVLEEDLDGIIVSLETLKGAKMINSVRKEKGLRPLQIFTVNRSCKFNLSSTFIREWSMKYDIC